MLFNLEDKSFLLILQAYIFQSYFGAYVFILFTIYLQVILYFIFIL